MLGKPYGGDLFLGEPCADDKRAEERLDSSHPLGFASLAKVHVQLIKVLHFGDRGGEAALYGLDVLSASGSRCPEPACKSGDRRRSDWPVQRSRDEICADAPGGSTSRLSWGCPTRLPWGRSEESKAVTMPSRIASVRSNGRVRTKG